MKKFFESVGFETALAGIFGLGALIAIFFEMNLADYDAASIAGGVKDICGTVIAVVMLLIAIRAFIPKKKKAGGFEEKFNEEMDSIISKYSPLLDRDAKVKGRYNIADNMEVLYQNVATKYHRMFDFDYQSNNQSKLTFQVSKTLFMGRSKEDFTDRQTIIINSITSKVTTEFDILAKTWEKTSEGFALRFSKELSTSEDAVQVAEVIDKVILLYVVECKK